MSRILAIDFGKKRTGLAVTDPLQIIANGLTTVATSTLMDFLKEYTSREKIECIVIGWPTQTNGQPSENQERIKSFSRQLKKQIPEIAIEFYDERFTSVLAHQVMLESGIGQQKRRNKALVDEVSATIILQSYLESKRMAECK